MSPPPPPLVHATSQLDTYTYRSFSLSPFSPTLARRRDDGPSMFPNVTYLELFPIKPTYREYRSHSALNRPFYCRDLFSVRIPFYRLPLPTLHTSKVSLPSFRRVEFFPFVSRSECFDSRASRLRHRRRVRCESKVSLVRCTHVAMQFSRA